MKFPEDFIEKKHGLVPNSTQWLGTKSNGVTVSIIGGVVGQYGDGVKTFEMFDMDESEPRGWMTKEEINQHLTR